MEHVLFDRMNRIKTSINFNRTNRMSNYQNLKREKGIQCSNIYQNMFWIGGSPCSGKSTIAEMLINKYGYKYYKCDDHLDDYIKTGVKDKITIMEKFNSMNLDETWLRDVDEQVNDEILFYNEAFKFVLKDLRVNSSMQKTIVEGAGLMPHLIEAYGISSKRYVSIIPTKEFQVEKYSLREWVKEYLKNCSDPEKAFSNWMERDAKFAQKVRTDAEDRRQMLIINDGKKSIENIFSEISRYWGFEKE